MPLRIRNSLERDDWSFARATCAATGNAGAPIEATGAPFFGEQWIAPYERLRPEWAYVAERSRARLGYLTGSPDTRAFDRERLWLHRLPLFVRTYLGNHPVGRDVEVFRARFIAAVRGDRAKSGASGRFPPDATEAVLAEYPAHLHLNLVAEARGQGVGRKLVDRFREDLVRVGVRGIHLYCGDGPLPFYERVGFSRLDQIEFRPGFVVYRLGSRF